MPALHLIALQLSDYSGKSGGRMPLTTRMVVVINNSERNAEQNRSLKESRHGLFIKISFNRLKLHHYWFWRCQNRNRGGCPRYLSSLEAGKPLQHRVLALPKQKSWRLSPLFIKPWCRKTASRPSFGVVKMEMNGLPLPFFKPWCGGQNNSGI